MVWPWIENPSISACAEATLGYILLLSFQRKLQVNSYRNTKRTFHLCDRYAIRTRMLWRVFSPAVGVGVCGSFFKNRCSKLSVPKCTSVTHTHIIQVLQLRRVWSKSERILAAPLIWIILTHNKKIYKKYELSESVMAVGRLRMAGCEQPSIVSTAKSVGSDTPLHWIQRWI